MGCRTRSPVTELLRVVVVDGALVPDPRRVLPGRGASLHPTPECLHAAERRRAFPRALRCSTPVEAGPLRAHVLGAGDNERQTAVPTAAPGTSPGRHVESRTSSDEPAVKSPR
ncbi:YlxR family protein [Blastococcus sp. SYSU D00868]